MPHQHYLITNIRVTLLDQMLSLLGERAFPDVVDGM
jgi:hypothetical protein